MRRLHLACAFVAVLGVALLLISRSPMSAQQAGARFRSTTTTSAEP